MALYSNGTNQITIVTAQNVTLRIELANIGDRFLAAILDIIVKAGIIIAASLALSLVTEAGANMGAKILYGIFIFVVAVLYSLLFEFFMKGQTPGKRLMKIRVARLDGEQVTFASILLRWFFRIIDFPIAIPTIGIFTIVATKKYQRLGDLVAGTVVVSNKNRSSLEDTFYAPAEVGYQPVFPAADRLRGSESEIIKQVLRLYSEKDNYDLVQLTAQKVKDLLQAITDMDDLTFLRTVLKDYNYSGSASPTGQE